MSPRECLDPCRHQLGASLIQLDSLMSELIFTRSRIEQKEDESLSEVELALLDLSSVLFRISGFALHAKFDEERVEIEETGEESIAIATEGLSFLRRLLAFLDSLPLVPSPSAKIAEANAAVAAIEKRIQATG